MCLTRKRRLRWRDPAANGKYSGCTVSSKGGGANLLQVTVFLVNLGAPFPGLLYPYTLVSTGHRCPIQWCLGLEVRLTLVSSKEYSTNTGNKVDLVGLSLWILSSSKCRLHMIGYTLNGNITRARGSYVVLSSNRSAITNQTWASRTRDQLRSGHFSKLKRLAS